MRRTSKNGLNDFLSLAGFSSWRHWFRVSILYWLCRLFPCCVNGSASTSTGYALPTLVPQAVLSESWNLRRVSQIMAHSEEFAGPGLLTPATGCFDILFIVCMWLAWRAPYPHLSVSAWLSLVDRWREFVEAYLAHSQLDRDGEGTPAERFIFIQGLGVSAGVRKHRGHGSRLLFSSNKCCALGRNPNHLTNFSMAIFLPYRMLHLLSAISISDALSVSVSPSTDTESDSVERGYLKRSLFWWGQATWAALNTGWISQLKWRELPDRRPILQSSG